MNYIKGVPSPEPGGPGGGGGGAGGAGGGGGGAGTLAGVSSSSSNSSSDQSTCSKSLLLQHYSSITNPLYLGPVNGDKVLGDGDVGLPLLVLGDILLFLLPLPLILIPLLWENIDYIYIVEHWSLSLICLKTQSD